MSSSTSEKNYLPEFFLACLGYFLFTAQDAIVKFMAEDYGVIQIIFVNACFAFIPIILYTQTLHGWEKLKKASFSFNQRVVINSEIMCEANVLCGCVDLKSKKPTALPEDLRKRMLDKKNAS